ncbi:MULTISPECIES: hypothetical protein [Myxococcus]|uniref:Nucleotidyltransferase n=1 Tax=Myxococcus llanfairpwllgwyngyllgogerychwyrndrobwllllantysiliogogogochensis TaxID=2590453 RepID=A0A540WZC3_9BACT|nr:MULTISPECIES: hypothetical protein [Myxococcus]NTX05837.1 hypothetical protein [Myxococcus sp. CA040A]NTX10449.1 hypothetical protein [Myxococcus sp. CA056]NTX50835.1 hypothetical protein [Myxococcus sp. CA039A]TQF14335.1 hypothetical protein FJV41_19090 [Myxococcus llanfairpwllgwyngyllgogerychwyrndrobwllllantysiliogogogochensis]
MQRTPEILTLLLDAQVQFVIIGGVAAVAHGSATFTLDLDIVAPFTEHNFTKLFDALAPYHPRYALAVPKRPVTEPPTELATYQNLYLLTDLGRLDILSTAQPVGTYDDVASKAVSMELYGHPCRIIGLDDLIAIKQHVGRDKDRMVARELLALRDRQATKPR